jgi:outer membrane murein-binding lipoprotein Lpp
MARILVRPVLLVVITLSLPLLAGCSGSDPRQQTDDSVAQANAAIDEHNQLFEQARATYTEAKDAIESEEDPSGEAGSITQARETMEEAQGKLQEAKQPLTGVQDLTVDPEIKEYTGLLSKALDAQIAAEGQEINFYKILESDPGLESDRKKALNTLAEVGDGYKKAKDAYGQAQKLADANPNLIKKS